MSEEEEWHTAWRDSKSYRLSWIEVRCVFLCVFLHWVEISGLSPFVAVFVPTGRTWERVALQPYSVSAGLHNPDECFA